LSVETVARLRADRWLWAARFFRTRALAQDALEAGKVRARGRVLDKGDTLKPSDVLTFVAGERLRTVEVLGLAEKRGDAAAAKRLYRDLHDPV
jgi:ribosome-associated heat shock protein Hsp15